MSLKRRTKAFRAMRVAIISTPFLSVPPKDYGGTELIVYELVEGLVDMGHDVTLFATGDSNTRAELAYFYEKPKWPPHPIPDLHHSAWAFGQVSKQNFDIVHAHSPCAL